MWCSIYGFAVLSPRLLYLVTPGSQATENVFSFRLCLGRVEGKRPVSVSFCLGLLPFGSGFLLSLHRVKVKCPLELRFFHKNHIFLFVIIIIIIIVIFKILSSFVIVLLGGFSYFSRTQKRQEVKNINTFLSAKSKQP